MNAAKLEPTNKKIVFVVNTDWYFLSHRLNLSKFLLDKGFEVTLITSHGEHKKTVESHGIKYISIPFSRQGINPLSEIKTVRALKVAIATENPSLVHAFGFKAIAYSCLARLFGAAYPSVNTVAGLGYAFVGRHPYRIFLRMVIWLLLQINKLQKDSVFIFQNRDDLEYLTSYKFVDLRRANVIMGSGVDLGRFKPNPEALAKQNPPLVLLPARMLRHKGLHQFVAAARKLKASGVNAEFALAGPIDKGNPAAVREEKINLWVKEKVISYLGNRRDMELLYPKCSIVVLPSYYREGIPLALLEAAASGCAIITTNMPGCRETVHEGVNGFLVPIKSAKVLAEKIALILNDKVLHERMSHASRLLVEKQFSIERVNEQYLLVYEKVLEDKPNEISQLELSSLFN